MCGNPMFSKEREKQLQLRSEHVEAKENKLHAMQDELDAAAEEFEERWQTRDLQAVVEPWLKRVGIPDPSAVSEKGWTPLHVVVEHLREGLLYFIMEFMSFRWHPKSKNA